MPRNISALPTATIVLRKSSRFKTWLQQIKGANTSGTKSKNGKTYDFVVTYPDAVGETALERVYKVGAGWYMFAQPDKSGAARDIRRIVVDSTGSIAEVSESEVREHFGLGPKVSKRNATPSFVVPDNAVRF